VGKLSLREAVKHFDVSRPTLQKAIKSGKLSGVQNGKGHWTIDPAEMARVYQPRSALPDKVEKALPGNFTNVNTPLDGEVNVLKSALALAEARADAAEKLAQERAERIEDLRRMLPPPVPAPAQSRWRFPWTKT
jgi:hypothetical protein